MTEDPSCSSGSVIRFSHEVAICQSVFCDDRDLGEPSTEDRELLRPFFACVFARSYSVLFDHLLLVLVFFFQASDPINNLGSSCFPIFPGLFARCALSKMWRLCFSNPKARTVPSGIQRCFCFCFRMLHLFISPRLLQSSSCISKKNFKSSPHGDLLIAWVSSILFTDMGSGVCVAYTSRQRYSWGDPVDYLQ